MNKFYLVSLLAGTLNLFTMPSTGHATGGGVSGGGNFVVCSEANGKASYQLLDYYDASPKGRYHFTLDLGPGRTYQEKIEYVLNRLARIDNYRATLYKKLASEFFDELEVNQNGDFSTDSNDIGSGYILSSNCKIKRVINLRSEDEKMLIGTDNTYEASLAWQDFDEETKAGAILHEIAYREALTRGATNSLFIRRYVGLISSKEILTANYTIDILKSGLKYWGPAAYPRMGVETNDFGMYGTSNFEAAFYYDGNRLRLQLSYVGELASPFLIKIENQSLRCPRLSISDDSNSKQKLLKTYFRLIKQPGLKFADLDSMTGIDLNGCDPVNLRDEMFPETKHKFDFQFDPKHQKIQTGGYPIFRHGFAPLLIRSGTIDGTDVSGQVCWLSRMDEVNCYKP